MKHRFERAYLRAPLRTYTLYQDDEDVLKAKILNISEGGVLIENLPHIPEISAIPLLLDMAMIPDLVSKSGREILALNQSDFKREIIRLKTRLVRQVEAESEVDKIFVTNIGCEFVKAGEKEKAIIKQYVESYTKNIIFLLNQFESSGKNIDVLRKSAELLGYNGDEKISLLRQKVLHDYQSLESP